MIDQFSIIERGGTILWAKDFIVLKGRPLDRFVREILLEERTSQSSLSFDSYTLEWTLSNDLGLVFVVIFQRLLPPSYSERLLSLVKSAFVEKFGERIKAEDVDTIEFDVFTSTFEKLHTAAEAEAMSKADSVRRSLKTASRKTTTRDVSVGTPTENGGNVGSDSVQENEQELDREDSISPVSEADQMMKNRAAFIAKRKKRKPKIQPKTSKEVPPPRGGKIMRPSKKNDKKEETVLDFSNESSGVAESRVEGDAAGDVQLARFREQLLEAKPSEYDLLDGSSDEEVEDSSTILARHSKTNGSVAEKSTVISFFKGLAGRKNLERSDMEAALNKFRDVLITKNVAQHIADSLIESVAANLEGKRMESWTRVATTIKNALDEALTRILTPRQGTDVLAEVNAHQASGSKRPYVIVFCGVNGVGKSTSLAKVCYYLLNHGKRVMIAAGDTFRAGAVEQLRTHVKCLGKGVELFDRGYGKDAASVAMEAIKKAQNDGFDVVLVDTAGRMQDNEPLMRALAKLVEINRPDRLFFVGEALVGNDAVDQLSKFNAALTDYQTVAKPRLIDGIVLTKFDTIDDKVGAAVSMVYTTGQPIVFVGIGQTYMDLRKCNTHALVRALLR
eukprot:Plantae.Rhodophyta-Hildenbrandia_rubra.ctg13130.p1 GENE.Plantae.Rhodophyta-Hildenbrandia_rubra.ctg13130~~Plantae.Rhodophyta-Hildenbrandia_rubra.ctg13130.p1  ORF type:complete len:618 (+),score=136.91 Plantae.Rhodophyta-Hildenbrandia_rubra.ctg13130:204-2057(+)